MNNVDPSSVADELGLWLDRPATRRVMIGMFGAVCLWVLTNGSPLGWDEGVYAARGEEFLDHSDFSWGFRSGTYWSDVRAPGLPALLSVPFWVFGVSGFVARAVVVVFAIVFLVHLGKTLDLFFPRRVGTTAVALSAICPGFIATSTLAFADIPAVFFGTLAVYTLAKCHVEDDTRRLFLLPIFLAIATTIRFGAVLLVAAPLAWLGLLTFIRLVERRDWRTLTSYAVAAVASVGAVALLLGTRLLTTSDSPLNATRALHDATANPDGNWLDDLTTILRPGPVDYGFDGAFWGWSFATVFGALALMAIARLLVGRRFVLLACCGVVAAAPVLLYAVTVNQFVTTYLAPIFSIGAAMVAVGLWAVNEPAVLATSDVTDVGPATVWPWLSKFGLHDRFAAVALFGGLAVALLLGSSARGVHRMHDRLWGFEQVRAASVIADDLLGEGCRVATSRVPQVAFYSECFTAHVVSGQALFDGSEDDAELARLGQQLNAAAGSTVALLLLEGVSGEPSIDDVWDHRVEDQSVILRSPGGRRVGVIALELP